MNTRERVHRRYFPPLQPLTAGEDRKVDGILQRASERVNGIPNRGTIFERIIRKITGK